MTTSNADMMSTYNLMEIQTLGFVVTCDVVKMLGQWKLSE